MQNIEEFYKNNAIDVDFDCSFYLREYPDVVNFYKNSNHLSTEEKLFYHYSFYGKKEGRSKNIIDQENSLINVEDVFFNEIGDKHLICPNNKLECLCLLTTKKEFENNRFQNFITQTLEKTKSSNVTKKINFYVFSNQKIPIKASLILELKKIFNDVKFIDLAIPPEEDVYLSEIDNIRFLPKYGLKSGPNIVFFKAISMLKKYNTTLFLETDCLLGEDWLNRLHNYVEYANGFLISGGLYDGEVFTKAGSVMMSHINGGTALYATGDLILQKLIEFLDLFLQKQVTHKFSSLAYDYALKLLIDYKINHNRNVDEFLLWKFINRNYLPCKLIINHSTNVDSTTNNEQIIKKYNYAILHKK